MRSGPLQKIISGLTIMTWNRRFRTNEMFPPPYRKGEYSPLLLDYYPEAKNIIYSWLDDNLATFNCENLANFMKHELATKLYEEIRDTCGLTFEDFTNSINLGSFAISTAWRYIQYFGYKWCDRKKSYYSDKHESEENISARIEFINKHRQYERDAHLWVQIPIAQASYLEANHGLLPNTAAYCYEGFREYHIDTHPSFQAMVPGLSVRKPMDVRPKIIMGQDETVVKQHTYSSKCWHSPSGASQLLPKSDGHAKMISAIMSRYFGLGIGITQQQLDEINYKRTDETSDWREYIGKTAAMDVYGSIKKNLPRSTPSFNTLIWACKMKDTGTTIIWLSRWRMYMM